MSRTIEVEPLQKHTLNLYEGDLEKLASFYPQLGATVALRRVIRAHIKQLESGLTQLPVNIEE